jgi:hypothetical protein
MSHNSKRQQPKRTLKFEQIEKNRNSRGDIAENLEESFRSLNSKYMIDETNTNDDHTVFVVPSSVRERQNMKTDVT